MRNNPYKTELKVARSQQPAENDIRQAEEMSCEWDGMSGWLETESDRLAESVDEHLKALEEQIHDWVQGPDSLNDD